MMKTIYLLILFFSVSFTKTDGFLFENSFLSVEFPGKPELDSLEAPSTVGPLTLKTAFYYPGESNKDIYIYGLITTEYPDSLINSDKKEILPGFFRNSIDGSVARAKGKLLSEKEIQIDQYPGREVQVSLDFGTSQAMMNMRVFLVKNKLIFLQIITSSEITDSTDKMKFFNSLKLK